MAGIHWNDAGLKEVLNSDGVATAVNKAAEAIADKVREQGIEVEGVPGDVDLPVKVETYNSDRERASVFLAHPSGLAVHAKHGALNKAASELGLEVNG